MLVGGDVGSDADLATYVNPPQIEALRKQWVRALAAGVKGAPAEQVLACVEAADPPAPFKGDPGRGGEKWWAELDAMTPVPEEIPIGGESASPAWNDFLLAEEALVGLLWHCQGDGDVLLAHVRDVAERFEVDHEAEIAAAAQAWQRTRARATELGWSPERPLAALDGERLE